MFKIDFSNIDSDSKPKVILVAKWFCTVFGGYAGIEYAPKEENGYLIYGDNAYIELKLSKSFWNNILNEEYNINLNQSLYVTNESSDIDYVATTFYFLNCLWERQSERETDKWGRSEFLNSIWFDFGLKKPERIVNQMFDKLVETCGFKREKIKSTVFLSHDIDTVNGAWKEDGKVALKSGKLFSFVKMLFKQITGNQDWLNFKFIQDLELSFGYNSTFFFLTSRRKIKGIGTNADYDISSKKMFQELKQILARNGEIGIHKSIDSTTLREELSEIPFPVISNRYHYLKYDFKSLIYEVSHSGIKLDCSLGYAEVIGYRNGYSLPFIPFDTVGWKPARFLEVPLCVMDATLSRYERLSSAEATNKLDQFIDENKFDSVISILWHNSHFTDFKYNGYRMVYKNTLKTCSSHGIIGTSIDKLMTKYL